MKPSFLFLTYLSSDVLNILCKLSCLFQSPMLNLAAIQPLIKSTIDAIASMKDTLEPYLAGVLKQLAETGEIVLVAERARK